ncbi:MAG: histidine kinase dimerization/phosphoacceptor domain -containing protein [Chloroflexota bacterium]
MTNLSSQLKQKSDQLAALREISRAIALAQDLPDTLDLITRRTTEVMHVESCSIYLYNDSRDKLILVASTGLNQDGIGEFFLPHGAGLTGWAAEYRKLVASTDASSDERFYRIIGSGESKFPSLMAMPLVSRGKVIGAANVQTEIRHPFTDEEVELFSFIFELAAVAIEKAQLVHKALVQEMHHRVKNNLQTIAMLLRLQADQPKQLSPKNILNESINRVLSIATVHEILSEAGVDRIGMMDLIKRVTHSVSTNMLNPEADITIAVEGDNIELPSQRATNLALVANELLQNALEHGIAQRKTGHIVIALEDQADYLFLKVIDDGQGLFPEFQIDRDLGLGLEIVQTTVTEDLQGQFEIANRNDGPGTQVTVKLLLDLMKMEEA